MSTHAQQVFYVEDGNDPAWSIVVPNSKHMFNGYSNDDELSDMVLEHCVIRSLSDIQFLILWMILNYLMCGMIVRVLGLPIINMKW